MGKKRCRVFEQRATLNRKIKSQVLLSVGRTVVLNLLLPTPPNDGKQALANTIPPLLIKTNQEHYSVLFSI